MPRAAPEALGQALTLALVSGVLLLAAAPVTAAAPPDLFGGGRLVAYTPSGWDPRAHAVPGPASLRADADELRRRGFRAITTPRSTPALMPVCRLFKRRGFRTVLVGVSDPRDATQLRTAEKQRRCADGYVVGDGGLAAGRYRRVDLEAALARLRRVTGKPVAVREELRAYDDDPTLLALGDWAFPIANPYLVADQRHPQTACGFSVTHYLDLSARVAKGVPVVLAETAFATAGDPSARENSQRAFFPCIETRAVRFEYFEAFDQPWRDPADGPAAHWGLFRADGTPKFFASMLAPPAVSIRPVGSWVRGRVRNAAPERFRVVTYVRRERWQVGPTSVVSRRGKWKARMAEGEKVAAVLMAKGSPPADGIERLPQVDAEHVFAVADTPPR